MSELFLVTSISHVHFVSVGYIQSCDAAIRPLTVHFLTRPPLPSFLAPDSTVGGSAGLNVVREALLKAQGPISLVQMHSSIKVSCKSPCFI